MQIIIKKIVLLRFLCDFLLKIAYFLQNMVKNIIFGKIWQYVIFARVIYARFFEYMHICGVKVANCIFRYVVLKLILLRNLCNFSRNIVKNTKNNYATK